MLPRKIDERLRSFFHSESKKALLITGARQVGKTFSIRQLGRSLFKHFIEINFLENKRAQSVFEQASDSSDLLLRLSALADAPLVSGETLVFLDEVQECKEIVTAIKFLVEEGSYRYVLSGSLLGVDLKDIRSAPVGYMDIIEMFPLDFEEYCLANQVSAAILQAVGKAFAERKPVDAVVHDKMIELFRLYLIVGGMPAVVSKYLSTNNLRDVIREQQSIVALYKKDIAKYDPENKLYLEEIFDLIPIELNRKNKRFILKNLNENFKFSRYSNSFLWLRDAGVALPVYAASQPVSPLLLSSSKNLFKLFMADVGLLASMCMDETQLRILNREKDINFGSIYENVVAQELKAHGFPLYYYNNKKRGELDFLIEYQGDVLPIEVKSGKDYLRHLALTNVMQTEAYQIPQAFVLSNENVCVAGKIHYLPVYMTMFLKKNELPDDLVYKIDLGVLR
ncbi:MAG: AAA family ATPase [Bacillota bacterium]|nr:AAA family ATPase [Bacillota bacterium]